MNLNQNNKPLALLYCDDLIFVSKISIAAKERGVTTRVITKTDLDSIDELVGIADLVLIDLNADHLNPVEFIRRIVNSPTIRDTEIICFVSHAHHDRIKEAEQFDCVTVLPRSKFVTQLSGIFEGIKQA